jgi:hypothetical protein
MNFEIPKNNGVKIFKKIRLAYELLPNFLKPGVKEYGKTGVTFDNDSSIGISTTTSTAARFQDRSLCFSGIRQPPPPPDPSSQNLEETCWAPFSMKADRPQGQ